MLSKGGKMVLKAEITIYKDKEKEAEEKKGLIDKRATRYRDKEGNLVFFKSFKSFEKMREYKEKLGNLGKIY